MNSESLCNVQSYSYGNEKPIVTFDATEALLGQKLSNGITVDGYRGTAEMQIEPVVSEHQTSKVQPGIRFQHTRSEHPRITSTEPTTVIFIYFILEDLSLCAIKRERECYICCV
jgi:hypothetical protein